MEGGDEAVDLEGSVAADDLEVGGGVALLASVWSAEILSDVNIQMCVLLKTVDEAQLPRP